MRSQGPFAEGDRVQLTDSKSRHITLTLQAGERYHTPVSYTHLTLPTTR